MKKKTAQSADDTSTTPIGGAPAAPVALPRSFVSRVNQLAHRKGKIEADIWRLSTTQALQEMLAQGVSVDGLSEALDSLAACTAPPGNRNG